VKLILNADGRWQVMVERDCRLLEPVTGKCTVHATPRQPKTCVFFNPHRCWYQRNFDQKATPTDCIRMRQAP
jgi:hypothetical protein